MTARRKTAPGKLPGADIVVKTLEAEGVRILFGFPGGSSMPIHQALTRSTQIRTILPRNEQGEIFMAEGYARVSGNVGVCLTTSGPGATNLVTGLANAKLDSVPIVAITGQVSSHVIGTDAFQEAPVSEIAQSITKHRYLVTRTEDIARTVREAFHIASTGRPGPVLVDIPKDIQQREIDPVIPRRVSLESYRPHRRAALADLREVAKAIHRAKRPVIYAGGGVILSGAERELLRLAEKARIPVTTTLMGIGGFPTRHPLALHMLGMHGSVYANYAVDEADLLLALGVRFDDRVTSNPREFARDAFIVHIDIDPSELNKIKPAQIALESDLRYALQKLLPLVQPGDTRTWLRQVRAWKEAEPFAFRDTDDGIVPPYVLAELDALCRNRDVIFTTGVGQHQMWSAQWLHPRGPRRFLTSGGLGTMGFGYPAAIGAQLARPEATVVDVDGDGAILMNIQELAVSAIEKLPVKVVILNNQHLGMVVQWEDQFYNGNRAHTYIGNPHIGDPSHPERSYPDFVKIADGFGIPGEKVIDKKEVRAALRRMLAAKGPYLLDILVKYQEHVLPMIPPGKTVREMIKE